MWLAILAVVVGLAILVWSADVFIDGAVALANKLNVPSFLIGVIILGLGRYFSTRDDSIHVSCFRR